MSRTSRSKNRAFSLIELVIVVVIIGIVAAIAIPRMSRGAAGANDSALTGNLAVLRKALDLYAAEHAGVYPVFGSITTALTTKTDINGGVAGTVIYGPYIRAIPALNVGAQKGNVAFTNTAPGASATAACGWYYDATNYLIKANCADAEIDSASVKYNTY